MLFVSFYQLTYLFFLGLSFLLFGLGILFLSLSSVVIIEWLLLSLNSTMVSYTIILDWMSLMFVGVVCFISCGVIFYSQEYMSSDFYMNRFVLLVVGFVFSMLVLIISPNLMGILLGWDGLGLISYCLVIYFQNKKSHGAGMLTALINRLGDAFLIISICWMLNYGCWHYLFYSNSFFMNYIIYFVLIASFTSSAQIPFSSWLPAAMAAPTPVSALVHSSTLVTAGVYLLIRFSSSLIWVDCQIFIMLSVATMVFAGVSALVEYDLSSIVALSTLSQLGLMMSCLLAGFPDLCFLHLLIHALFKSLMFLCVGVYIHSYESNQDIRLMGLVFVSYPIVSICFFISCLALSAMPFLSGYYSSDLIMEFISMTNLNLMMFFMFYLSACLTGIYSFRASFYSLLTPGLGGVSVLVGGEGGVSCSSIMIISFVSLVSGSSLFWLVLENPSFIMVSSFVSSLPLILLILGLIIVLEYLGVFLFEEDCFWVLVSKLGGSMWFMSSVGNRIGLVFLSSSCWTNNYLDNGWFELYGPRGLVRFFFVYVVNFYSLSFNSIKLFIVWVLVLMCLFVLWG
uniref:NADH-ubiquinone oxidoreductase chain 5 n=1 Tax=Hemiodoecus leai TaxID=1254501 RepID=A0A0U1XEJ0_9HEMI|nr:NADH dehydrogenase subunit 5 [Hemiodoecus leai]AIS38310.1 NADH dehydrogenase subunit 5 [Hemiodoecus leai]